MNNLEPLDVGGGGDCFFKAVSHQLYHSCEYHQSVRKAGIDYISGFPEQFIESIANNCWNDYTVEHLIADTPFKRTSPNRFFYKILVILPLLGGHLSLA